jgi:hypothetical protein
MVINWEAVIGICAVVGMVGAVVRWTLKAGLAEFKEDLRKEFITREHFSELERRVSRLEAA